MIWITIPEPFVELFAQLLLWLGAFASPTDGCECLYYGRFVFELLT